MLFRSVISVTAWKVSKYGVFSGQYFPAFGPEKTPYLDTFTQWVLLLIIWKYINRIRNDHTRAIEERQNDFGKEAEKLNVLKVI